VAELDGEYHPWWNDKITAFKIDGSWDVLKAAYVHAEQRIHPQGGIAGFLSKRLGIAQDELWCYQMSWSKVRWNSQVGGLNI
jgi:hypothetical protein